MLRNRKKNYTEKLTVLKWRQIREKTNSNEESCEDIGVTRNC